MCGQAAPVLYVWLCHTYLGLLQPDHYIFLNELLADRPIVYLFIATIAEFDLFAGRKSDAIIRREVKKPAEQNLREIMERILARDVIPKSDAVTRAPRNGTALGHIPMKWRIIGGRVWPVVNDTVW